MKKILGLLIGVFAAILFFALFSLVSYYLGINEGQEQYDELAQLVQEAKPTAPTIDPTDPIATDPEATIPAATEPVLVEATSSSNGQKVMILPEYKPIYELNDDFVGWICIEDTRINYPVMQSPGRPNFYLDHGFDKSETDYGCPYVPRICEVNRPSDNVIIYGHHKKNGTMFTDLTKFQKKSFWETHKTFSFDTLYEKQTFEIVVVFKTVVYTNSDKEFKYYQFADAETPEKFDAYLAECQKRALYDTGVTAEYGDKLITLSTCEYSRKNGRLVVVAKRVEE